jgi:hypothetical protein
MKHVNRWILALLVLAAAASLSGAWTSVQDPQKKKIGRHPAQEMAKQRRQARHAALREALPTLTLRMSEAVALAEKDTQGRAYSAGLEIIEGKPSYQVNLFVADKFTVVDVDPETRKVTVAAKKTAEENGEGEGDGASDGAGDEEDG